jgi:plastocyanin
MQASPRQLGPSSAAARSSPGGPLVPSRVIQCRWPERMLDAERRSTSPRGSRGGRVTTETRSHRGAWLVLVTVMAATAIFVPIRIAYKQNQTVATKPGRVTIVNYAFTPTALTVPAGTKITLTNSDGTLHTATASDKSFDSGPLEPGKSYSTKITKSVTYFCAIHNYMKATIKVRR